jgi:hypothetical protein
MTPSDQPTPIQEQAQQPAAPIEFRPLTSGGNQAIVLYTNGQFDHTVFTIYRDETRDVTARRLAQAFHTVLDMGAMIADEMRKHQEDPTDAPKAPAVRAE